MHLDEKKQQLRNLIPKRYNPTIHWLFTGGISAGILAYMLINCVSFGAWWLATVPFFILFLFMEWMIHYFLLHKNLIKPFYRFHQNHHLLFQKDSMNITSYRDLYWVLIPQSVYLLALLAATFTTSLLLLINAKLAGIFLISFLGFHIFYEVLHTAWHLADSKFGRHHALHHTFLNMHSKNLNVTIPLVDVLFGTKVKE